MVGGVPNLEPTPRRLEIGHERLVELLELFAELKDREIQPALRAAAVKLPLSPGDRGSAMDTRHVVRVGKGEHRVSDRNKESIGRRARVQNAPRGGHEGPRKRRPFDA
jgi:hypothetical protein